MFKRDGKLKGVDWAAFGADTNARHRRRYEQDVEKLGALREKQQKDGLLVPAGM